MTCTIKRSRNPDQETTHRRPDDGITGEDNYMASNPTGS